MCDLHTHLYANRIGMSAKRFNFIAQQRENCNRGERESGKMGNGNGIHSPRHIRDPTHSEKATKIPWRKKAKQIVRHSNCHSQDVTQEVPSAIVRLARYRFACIANSNFISNSLTCVDYCLLIFNLFLIFCAFP